MPSLLIASPIRHRPECPEVLPAFLSALRALKWNGPVEFRTILHREREIDHVCPEEDQIWEALGGRPESVIIPSMPDSRHVGGPRHFGETQETIAFLRNRIFRYWAHQTKCDLLLMVDSDVILNQDAARVMATALYSVDAARSTVSLQIDNRVAEDHQPTPNAEGLDGKRVPWETDGRLTEVFRSGACTLYPRAVLGEPVRFGWAPGYSEEHQSLFDGLRARKWRHFLLQASHLADHRMRRDPPLMTVTKPIEDERTSAP